MYIYEEKKLITCVFKKGTYAPRDQERSVPALMKECGIIVESMIEGLRTEGSRIEEKDQETIVVDDINGLSPLPLSFF